MTEMWRSLPAVSIAAMHIDSREPIQSSKTLEDDSSLGSDEVCAVVSRSTALLVTRVGQSEVEVMMPLRDGNSPAPSEPLFLVEHQTPVHNTVGISIGEGFESVDDESEQSGQSTIAERHKRLNVETCGEASRSGNRQHFAESPLLPLGRGARNHTNHSETPCFPNHSVLPGHKQGLPQLRDDITTASPTDQTSPRRPPGADDCVSEPFIFSSEGDSKFRVTLLTGDIAAATEIEHDRVMGSCDAITTQWGPRREPARKMEDGSSTTAEGKSREDTEDNIPHRGTSEISANTDGQRSLRDEATMTTHDSSDDDDDDDEEEEEEVSVVLALASARNGTGTLSAIGTPSTVSTAPSTDDASILGDYKLDDVPSMLAPLLHSRSEHNRTPSSREEEYLTATSYRVAAMHSPTALFRGTDSGSGMWQQQQRQPQEQQHERSAAVISGMAPHAAWQGAGLDGQRVASFRDETDTTQQLGQRHMSIGTSARFDSPLGQTLPGSTTQSWSHHLQHRHQHALQQHHQIPHQPQLPNSLPFRTNQQPHQHLQSHQQQAVPSSPFQNQHQHQHRGFRSDMHHPTPMYNMSVGASPYQHNVGRKEAHTPPHHQGHPPLASPNTGTRSARSHGGVQGHHQHHHRQPGTPGAANSPQQGTSSSHRSSSEILKTLLRKKACLYETDTSRAVALVTWLVGRELALEFGYFSRQQLQSGVHACVAGKIDSGIITRTKVNRCMQIILNSCFHYIIPRSDGTEENGDLFREKFAVSVCDDSPLLRYLTAPWNDLSVSKEMVLSVSMHDHEMTPPNSPRLSGMTGDKSPKNDVSYNDHAESKRAVLLCFNENVRSADDVFRCHNEFIRDTANASHLQLSGQEWCAFFGRDASRGQFLWGDEGAPRPQGTIVPDNYAKQVDALGQMNREELAKFRTSWCSKRYEHDHSLCGFAHAEVNGGWLRRNPSMFDYREQMCPFVSTCTDKSVSPVGFFINQCPKGSNCEYAHSHEEIIYHPRMYKSKVCNSGSSHPGSCRLGDICPRLHLSHATRHPRRHDHRGHGSHGHRHSRKNDAHGGGRKASAGAPGPSPIIYVGPAPVSSFEQQLEMPGLKCLFRRHGSVIKAHVRSEGNCDITYNAFGDDWGIGTVVPIEPSPLAVSRVRRF